MRVWRVRAPGEALSSRRSCLLPPSSVVWGKLAQAEHQHSGPCELPPGLGASSARTSVLANLFQSHVLSGKINVSWRLVRGRGLGGAVHRECLFPGGSGFSLIPARDGSEAGRVCGGLGGVGPVQCPGGAPARGVWGSAGPGELVCMPSSLALAQDWVSGP